MAFNHKHLIDITEYSEEDIKLILETAKAFSEVNERAIKKVPTLKGKTIVNMFNEPSTRTRSSFELAEKRLSADSLNFGGSSTSTVKGESLVDTVETLNAYKIDCIVVRDKHAGAPYIVTQNSPASVICAGDGKHNHPTQALLDLYTIWEHKGDFHGLKVAVVGDIAHRLRRQSLSADAPPTDFARETQGLACAPWHGSRPGALRNLQSGISLLRGASPMGLA